MIDYYFYIVFKHEFYFILFCFILFYFILFFLKI